MQSRLPIVVSITAAILAVILLNLYVSGLRETFEPPRSEVVAASHDLRAGQIVEEKDLMRAVKVRDSLPKFAIPWGERLNYVGQATGAEVSAGDYVLSTYFGTSRLLAQRASDKLDPKLNQRLFTIPVNEELSLEGAIRPGDRIDLLLTYTVAPTITKAGAAQQQTVTTTLLQNVYVVYTGRFGSGGTLSYGSITVIVSPEEAMLLTWATKLGKLSILLRHSRDLQIADRTYLSGDPSSLQALGRTPLRIDEVIAKQQAGAAETR